MSEMCENGGQGASVCAWGKVMTVCDRPKVPQVQMTSPSNVTNTNAIACVWLALKGAT